jgi:hypothetical protein
MSELETLEWITGNDPSLEYVDLIGGGGYGQVYKVQALFQRYG